MKEEFFVLRYPNGDLVALDERSGGYPWPTDKIYYVEKFRTIEDAKRYCGVMNKEGFTIHKATLTLVTEPVDEVDA